MTPVRLEPAICCSDMLQLVLVLFFVAIDVISPLVYVVLMLLICHFDSEWGLV